MTPNLKTQTKTTINDLFARFDLALFERLPDGLFRPVGQLPDWLAAFFSADNYKAHDLVTEFPILEIFLPEFEIVWTTGSPEQMRTDVWTETTPAGAELYLEAIAAIAEGRPFLGIRSLPQALFTYQQLAHDFELEKEKVERLSRELDIKRREAERATQAKSDFLATMSHEFRTPLNAIIGMADVLALTSLSAEQQKYVDIFQRSGVSLLNLINEILDLSKVEAGHIELERADLDLQDVLARAMEVVEVRTAAKGLWLRQAIAPDVPRYLIGDPNRLRQIIINLLGNAIKFTEQGGLDIKVELDPEQAPDKASPGRLRFSITDTGIGIPEDKLGLIFESFTQADSSTTRKYGGTGLGLTISKQLVELMDGRIWVESQPGVGSTFFFTGAFDVQDDQTVRSPPSAGTEPQTSLEQLESLAAGLRILLVDDSEANRILIIQYLKKIPLVIEVAENGQTGLDLFKVGQYDLVLMDCEMPVMDGYTAVAEIRRFETANAAKATPVLALTAHAFASMKGRGIEAGFTDLLTKPIRRVTLLEALARFGHSSPASVILATSKLPEPAISEPAIRVRQPGPIRIRIEEGMEDVVPGYLEKRRNDIDVYRESLSSSSFDAIQKLAHKMKGTGGGYGFPELTDLGGAMESAAMRSDATALAQYIEEFSQYLENVVLE